MWVIIQYQGFDAQAGTIIQGHSTVDLQYYYILRIAEKQGNEYTGLNISGYESYNGKNRSPSQVEATVSELWRGVAGMARSMVESPINVVGRGLALLCATRISKRLNAIPAVGKFCVHG